MSPRLPRLTAREVQRVLEKRGFRVVRASASHWILRDSLGRRVTLPYHAGRTLHPKILGMIMEDAGLTEADFDAW
jgi:predicted RNA binding protein YcfA (HicA-like mRNA interferase family)